jgi:DNA-binding SARP family transcriptional activator/tetratricopeptide (TPR) repeat protein
VLTVSLLGERGITGTAGAVPTRSSRSVALLAYLVVHGDRPQPRTRIAALFWPDSTDEQSLTNLRRELHHLRRALDDDESLQITAKDLWWQDTATCRVDVREFAREHTAAIAAAQAGHAHVARAHAVAAVGHYGGDLLPGSYDEWLLDARAELEQQNVDLLDLMAEAELGNGDVHAAADATRRRIGLRPLEEIGYRRLIELYGRLGDRARAVSTYHRCASILERELGVEPDPETRRALDRLLARSRPAAPPNVDIPDLPVAGRHNSGPAAAPLVGREPELDTLRHLWHAARDGRPAIVLVHGQPGVGKTRLMAELAAAAARDGGVVATAQCFGAAGQLAFSPVADWLRTPAVAAAAADLEPVWRVEVERLVPSTKDRGATGYSARAMVDAWQRHRFFEGLARALLAVDRPMLLTLDNAQWCDEETLAFLAFCLGIAGDRPLMVAATVREGEPSAALDAWTTQLRTTGLLTDVGVDPLEPAESIALAEAIAKRQFTADEADLLHATTGGFPLYVVEAARIEPDRSATPHTVGDLRSVLRSRFDQVGPSARTIAELAAAIGRNFTLDLLTEASDLDVDEVVCAIDELWRHRLIRETGDGYDFSHDLLRDTAYAQISPPTRWLLHRRIAQTLEMLHQDDLDAVATDLAEQYVRSGRPQLAIAYYERAAEVASGMFAHAEAIRLHRQALAIVETMPPGRDRIGRELSLLEALAAPLNARCGYASTELGDTMRRAVTLAETLADRDRLLSALVGLYTNQFVQGWICDAERTATRALTLVGPNSALGGAAHFAMGMSELSLGRPASAVRHLEHAAARGNDYSLSVGTRPDVHGLAYSAHAHWLLGNDDLARATCGDAITLARAVDTPYSLAVALAYGAMTQQLRRDDDALSEIVTELCDLCERYDFAYYREWALILAGWHRGGDDGFELARQGVANLSEAGALTRMPYWLSLVADIAQRNGRPDVARARLDAAITSATARSDLWWLPEVQRMRAAYDPTESATVARLESAVRLAESHGSRALVTRAAADLAVLGVPVP